MGAARAAASVIRIEDGLPTVPKSRPIYGPAMAGQWQGNGLALVERWSSHGRDLLPQSNRLVIIETHCHKTRSER